MCIVNEGSAVVGSVGDMLYFHSYKHDPSLIVDIARDIRKINDIALNAKKSGTQICGSSRRPAKLTTFCNHGAGQE